MQTAWFSLAIAGLSVESSTGGVFRQPIFEANHIDLKIVPITGRVEAEREFTGSRTCLTLDLGIPGRFLSQPPSSYERPDDALLDCNRIVIESRE